MTTPHFVQWFREAAPYIHAFRGRVFVIAFGGEVLSDGKFANLSHDLNVLVSLGVRIVLVHGARPQVEAILQQYGQGQRFHLSRRVTDLAGLEIVKQAVGYTRAEIESWLSMALPNSPMAGANLRVASGNYVIAKPLGVLEGVDMQYTGQVRKLETAAITARLEAGELVMLSPLGYSPTGEMFNLTLEDVATAAAIGLKAEKLVFLTDADGVLDEAGVLKHQITASEAEGLLASQVPLSEDIAVYLPCALRAIRQGVNRAHFINYHTDGGLLTELFTHDGLGSMVSPAPLDRLREATIDDVGDILSLIEPLEREGILVKRSRELLEMEIQKFSVLAHDGRIVGCVAMNLFGEAGMAELACLAVSPEWAGEGYGEALLHHVESQARASGVFRLFVLTTRTAHWFIERGFAESALSALPPAKQQFYNYQRRSKVFLKNL
jgi:amino-acid N-acetyltransferase